ncbi:hypothetical protein QZH41_016548 [Actinostola sp. cb2023]|nr:hypothetical protein QZH41_016548 [Actinostola sp. cb2023]
MADEFMTRCSSSTVFACDLSSDTRYIRCDFPQCSEHGQAVQAKPSWMLNTLKNVRILEKHVGKEIHNYMKSQPLRCVFSESRHKTESKEFIERNQLPVGTKKVLAVFNLKDSQSQLGEWLAHFLDAAFISEYGDKRKDFVVLTQDFVSRYELMKSISNLEFLKSCSPKVEVTCVLSCHSSSQGQVFSCTPSDISKEHGFEEFCSLHDMTVDCQDALGDTLSGIHISSCFTLKLDCSHEEWPVDSSWFKNKLKCRLTGSVREVYETGSQVCDLHILLTAILSPPIAPLLVGSCGERLQKAICNAQTESFPDLALEMGLEILDDKAVDTKLLTPGTDDKLNFIIHLHRPCVFSPGAYINNRSLMPCQEPPVAMSTWHAAIRVPKGCMVYMSGCPIPVVNSDIMSDKVTHYYEMDSALPCSTLALAVGWLAYREGSPAMVPTTQGSQRPIPCRIIAVPSLIDVASTQLLEHSSRYLVEACKLLGPYPFDRLDLLILPRCFACMGLKSPNLAFLSQSILSSDSSLRLRVAHEVTHAWFGLLIGAKDWTEEWLSEGFATYLEDTVQSRAEKWPVLQDQQYREIRQVLRYRTLSAEMQVTDKDMQCLRLVYRQIERAEETNVPPDEEQPAPSTIIKYKCSKKWTQVHYLKGYFLLIHMENMVGRQNFEKFLHDYVQHYQGRLVTSEDFFEFFLRSFTMFDDAVQDGFIHEWLECSGLPKSLRRKNFAGKDNVLVNQALHEFEFWRRQDTTNKRNKAKKAKSRKEPENFTLQTSEQIVLMLEKLLQRDDILHTTLRQLNKVYQFATRNAEIRHRWCELVVKHKYTTELKDVRQFLIEDQGMGIYLFGELIISGQGKQRALAEEIFEEIGPEMDRCTFKTVSDMLAGVD